MRLHLRRQRQLAFGPSKAAKSEVRMHSARKARVTCSLQAAGEGAGFGPDVTPGNLDQVREEGDLICRAF
jgi:hypothetical protein